MYFIVREVDRYIGKRIHRIDEEKIGNKYLVFASTDKNKELLKNYTKLWDKTKSLIKNISDEPDNYDEKYIKIRFNLNDNLPLNKILKLQNLTIIVRSIFEEDKKYYQQIFLDERFYEL